MRDSHITTDGTPRPISDRLVDLQDRLYDVGALISGLRSIASEGEEQGGYSDRLGKEAIRMLEEVCSDIDALASTVKKEVSHA